MVVILQRAHGGSGVDRWGSPVLTYRHSSVCNPATLLPSVYTGRLTALLPRPQWPSVVTLHIFKFC